MGKTILISSHILPELADLCTSVGVLERGELLFHGSIEEIIRRAKLGVRVEIVVPNGMGERAAGVLRGLEAVRGVESANGRLVVELATETHDFSFLARALLDADLPLREIREEQVNLETAFMRLTKGTVQ